MQDLTFLPIQKMYYLKTYGRLKLVLSKKEFDLRRVGEQIT